MKYAFLNNLSGAAVLVTVTLMFAMLFESRYPRKKYLSSLLPFLGVLFAVNFYVIFHYGFPAYGKVTLFIATIPSLIYFFLVALHRDGRFFFTFCLVDTASIWLALVTGVCDYYLGGEGRINVVLRFALAPLVLYLVYRWGRRPFFGFLHTVSTGWWLFSGLTGMVYIILIVVTSIPTNLRDRPEDIPLAMLIAAFLPVTYGVIFYMLHSQQQLHEMNGMDVSLEAQAAAVKSRAEELHHAEEKLQVERSSLEQRLTAIREMAVKGDSEQALDALDAVRQALDRSGQEPCCTDPTLDAILIAGFRRAAKDGILVERHLSITGQLPVPAADLAAVVSNAMDSAIRACQKLPRDQRRIVITGTTNPTFLLEIKCRYPGDLRFDDQGLPITDSEGHVLLSRSLLAFVRKYHVACDCGVKNGWLQLIIAL